MTTQTKTTWRTVRLGDVIEKPLGGDWGQDQPDNEFSQEVYAIRGTDFSALQAGDFSSVRTRYVKKSSMEKRQLKAGDIVMEISGGSKGQPVGRTFLITADTLAKAEKLLIYSNFCRRIRASKANDPYYLYYQLQKFYSSPEVLSFQTQSTGISNFHFTAFTEHKQIPQPELSTQKEIGRVLVVFDEKIENNNRIIKTLEEMAQAIFKEWFVKLRFPGYEKVEFVDSELGEIPKGWEVKGVLDVVERISVGKKFENKTALPNGKVPILDQGQSGFIGYHNEEPGVMASTDKPVIVFTNHTCYYRLVTYPFSAIQNVLPYVGANGYPTLFVYYLTKDKIKMQEYKGHWPEFEQQEFVVAPPTLAEEYTNFIRPMVQEMVEAENENQKLAAMRDLLLPRLMSGEVRV